MARSLMKYRFSPLDAGDDRDQHGVLIIAPEDEEVLP
jgi:hypothetical protein